MQLETTPSEHHERSDYMGPATLKVGEEEFQVEVELRGFFQTIDATYRWHGWARQDEALAEALGTSKPQCQVRTEHGESPAKLDEIDLWGRRRLLGVGRPPFPMGPSLEDLDEDE